MPMGRHYVGAPPLEKSAVRKRLPLADVVVLEQASIGRDTGYFLYRYTSTGAGAGSTWHETEPAALRAAVDEYGTSVGPWIDIPEYETDEVAFAVRLFASTR